MIWKCWIRIHSNKNIVNLKNTDSKNLCKIYYVKQEENWPIFFSQLKFLYNWFVIAGFWQLNGDNISSAVSIFMYWCVFKWLLTFTLLGSTKHFVQIIITKWEERENQCHAYELRVSLPKSIYWSYISMTQKNA